LAGKTASYRVAAINGIGTGPYAVSANGAILPVANKQPGAPTGLTITPQTGTANLRLDWTAPSGSPNAAGYIVQCSASGKQPWNDLAENDDDCPGAQPSAAATTTTATVGQGITLYYRVAATDAAGEVNRTNRGPYSASVRLGGPADQMGTVTLSTRTPMVGVAITATLMDADTPLSDHVWEWQKSMTPTDMASWVAATGVGATTMSYTPETMDEGYSLRATAMYTDKYRSGMMAYSMATDAVTEVVDPRSRLLAQYDTNGTEGIQIDEVNRAIDDFFDNEITLVQVNIVIDLFFE